MRNAVSDPRVPCRTAAAMVIAVILPLPAYPEIPAAFDTGAENHSSLTFSPDGSTAYWVAWNGKWGSDATSRRTIYVSRRKQGAWTAPAPAEFTTMSSDDDPFVSPDGRWLYFVSDRPTATEDTTADANIWRNSLADPHRIESLAINSDATEYSPVVTTSGAIYFASDRTGGTGQGDLYRAAAEGEGFLTPELLGPAFNTPQGEWNLWVSPAEDEIIFEASSRPTNVSIPGDLYYSWRSASGWVPAVTVERLNTAASDLMPRLHPDGETLYYTSAPIGGHARILSAGWIELRDSLHSSFAQTLLVANRSSHEVSFVDLSLGEVRTGIPTGEGPHLLSNVSDGRVLATGYGEFPKPHVAPVSARPPFVTSFNSRLTAIDTVNAEVLLDTVIDNCRQPHASWIVDTRGYVTCEAERQIAVLDLQSGRTVARFDTQQQGSHVLSFDTESRTLVVSNTGSGSLTLIDTANGDRKILPLGPGTEGALAVAGRIWVGNAGDGSVSVVDPREGTIVRHIPSVCGFPIAMSEDTRNQVWVACFASSELVAIDRMNFEIRKRLRLVDAPLNLILHPARDLAYVSLTRQNAVAEIDLASGREIRRIAVGIEPDGLRWAPRVQRP